MQKRHIIHWCVPAVAALGLGLAASAGATNEIGPVIMNATPVVSTVLGYSDIGAQIEEKTVTRDVKYGDLNLATRAGASALRQRVQAAVQAACLRLYDATGMNGEEFRSCERTTRASAMRQVRHAVAVADALARKA